MTVLRTRWLLDLGNSRLKCARLDAQGRRGEIIAIGHEHPDGLASLLAQLGAARSTDEVWLASVASAARTAALEGALRSAGFEVRQVRTQPACGRLRIAYAQPQRLGVDRFLALLAASTRDDGPWLLVSAGSALTVDLLAADGEHIGGAIAPMPDSMRTALAQGFTQLDMAPGVATDFAVDTADAIASGCDGAAIGLVERSLRLARTRLGTTPTLLVAGGAAALLASIEHAPVFVLPALVLDGMAAFARLQDA